MRLVLTSKKAPSGDAQGAAPENLQSFAAGFIPHEAKDVVFVKQVPSPFTLEGNPTTEFLFNCTVNGNTNCVSVSVVERSPKERITVIIMAHARDFDSIHTQGIGSLFRWTVK